MNHARKEERSPLALRMKQLRTEHERTQQECADALGVGQSTYNGMEQGTIRVRRRDLVTLAVLYGEEPESAFPSMLAERQEAA